MELKIAEEYANYYIHKYLDCIWSFKWHKEPEAWGLCDESDWTVGLSKRFVEHAAGEAYVIDTILHEVAHALVGCARQHDDVWKATALKLGAEPTDTGGNEYIKPSYFKYRLIVKKGSELEVLPGGWVSKPTRPIKYSYLPQRRESTRGKLFYAKQYEVALYLQGHLTRGVNLWQ